MNVGENIVDEILSWLPVRSLLRLKVVCKDWYVKIQSHSFIALHKKNQTTKILIHQEYADFDDDNVVSICSKEDVVEDDTQIQFHESNIQQYCPKDMPLHDCRCYDRVDVIGTCNGLVCLDYFGWSYRMTSLWNPATREFKTLPPFNPPPPNPGTKEVGARIGFGFDCTKNDYKVIQFYQFQKKQSQGYINLMKIYSLGANCWKEYDCSDLSTKICIQERVKDCSYHMMIGSTVFWNKKFCWLARDTTSSSIGDLMILSFDMSKEVFQTIPSPFKYMELVRSPCVELFTLHDSIAIVHYDAFNYKIWTLKDFEQGCSSWIKMSNIDTTSKIHWALGFWNRSGNQLLFLFKDDEGIAAMDCNKSKDSMKKIIVNDCVDRPLTLFTYVETLVSLDIS